MSRILFVLLGYESSSNKTRVRERNVEDTNRVYTDGVVSRVFEFDVAASGVGEADAKLRSNSLTLRCWPSVTRGGVAFQVDIAGGGDAQLTVFDRTGRRVRTFASMKVVADMTIRWDGNDDHGRSVPSGVYLVRLKANRNSVYQKIVKLE